jgi:hypothetical protein
MCIYVCIMQSHKARQTDAELKLLQAENQVVTNFMFDNIQVFACEVMATSS